MNSQNNQTNIPTEQQPTAPYKDPDEINLLEYVYVLVKHKWWIIGATVLGLVFGYVAAVVKGPTYVAEVVLAPKESDSKKGTDLSSFGALGGLVAGQLNIGGNTSLEKISMILDSREFSARLIDRYNLLPEIYKNALPKQYKKSWDTLKQDWKSSFVKPRKLDMGGLIKGKYLKKSKNDKSGLLTITVESKDTTFSKLLATDYVEYLNEYIKSETQKEAKENVIYLKMQMDSISDPLIREKVLALISSEIEKAMVTNKEAFKIFDPIYTYPNFKKKKMYPLVFSAGLFFCSLMIIIMMYAFSSAEKTEEDRLLIGKIKKEFKKIF